MNVRDFRRIFIYHSPQYPGYTCWCGLWMMPDNSVMCSFTQATGPAEGRPKAPPDVRRELDWPPEGHGEEYDMTGLDLQNIHLRSTDLGLAWTVVSGDHFTTCMNGAAGEAETALPDGTIVRGVWGPYLPYDDVPRTGYVERSADGSRTWSAPQVVYESEAYLFWPKRIRVLSDGRVLIGGGLIRKDPQRNDRGQWSKDMTVALFGSEDDGRSWHGPSEVVPKSQRNEFQLTEEFDFAELDNGDLLLILRADAHHARLQTRLIKKGDTWTTTHIDRAPLPPSGHPELLKTSEGPILHVATTGLSYTDDEGKTWHDLTDEQTRPYPTPYYPKSVQLPNHEILIIGHVGSDNGYHTLDQSIIGSRFFMPH